jgi:hypothetical protein
MSGIQHGNDWDDELFTDRVDILRPSTSGTKNPSGQYRPVRSTIASSVPCKIQRMESPETVQSTSQQASQLVQVAFPFAVEVAPGDLLQPVMPSSGNVIRAGSYSYDTTLEFGQVKGVEVT